MPHQIGDFFVMLGKKFTPTGILFFQLLSGSGSFIGGAISQMIPEKYNLGLSVFSMISFAFTIFNTIFCHLVEDDLGKNKKMLVMECAMIFFGYFVMTLVEDCLLYTSPSPRDLSTSRMPSSA